MSSATLALLGGSLREESYTLATLHVVSQTANAHGFDSVILDVRALNLPMYRPDFDEIEQYPTEAQASIRHVIETCRSADAFVFASPVYHGTVSGVFKNMIDFIEYLSEDERPYLHRAPVGLITTNESRTFGAMMQIVHELRGWIAPTQIVVEKSYFTAERQLNNPRIQARIERMVDELSAFLK